MSTNFYAKVEDRLYSKGYKNVNLVLGTRCGCTDCDTFNSSFLKSVHDSILAEQQYQKTISNETYFTPDVENYLYKMFKEYNQETSLAQICKTNSKEFNDVLFENQIYQIIDASKQGKYKTIVDFSNDCSNDLITQFMTFITEHRLICIRLDTKSVMVKWL
jgi:hypothetical protein